VNQAVEQMNQLTPYIVSQNWGTSSWPWWD